MTLDRKFSVGCARVCQPCARAPWERVNPTTRPTTTGRRQTLRNLRSGARCRDRLRQPNRVHVRQHRAGRWKQTSSSGGGAWGRAQLRRQRLGPSSRTAARQMPRRVPPAPLRAARSTPPTRPLRRLSPSLTPAKENPKKQGGRRRRGAIPIPSSTRERSVRISPLGAAPLACWAPHAAPPRLIWRGGT